MFNVGGPELLVILLLALIVLGPQRLPDASRQIGRFMSELRRMSSGFQQELRSALDEPVEAEARARGAAAMPPVGVPAPPSDAAAPATPPRPPAKAPARRRTAPLRAPRQPGSRQAP